jgi:hypothetical protein
MHFDAGCGCTESILLAEYFKSVIIGDKLPADLQEQALTNPFLRSVLPGRAPPATDYAVAFTPLRPPSPD